MELDPLSQMSDLGYELELWFQHVEVEILERKCCVEHHCFL
jgi:hypothetical protein